MFFTGGEGDTVSDLVLFYFIQLINAFFFVLIKVYNNVVLCKLMVQFDEL